jgi:hypothetical protein
MHLCVMTRHLLIIHSYPFSYILCWFQAILNEHLKELFYHLPPKFVTWESSVTIIQLSVKHFWSYVPSLLQHFTDQPYTYVWFIIIIGSLN